jgi:hypothetical protein
MSPFQAVKENWPAVTSLNQTASNFERGGRRMKEEA